MHTEPSSAGDMIPRNSGLIEVRVAELRQLFNAIDPSPFRERDLDPRAEEFIVDWSRDLPADARLALLIHVQHPPARQMRRSFFATQFTNSSERVIDHAQGRAL